MADPGHESLEIGSAPSSTLGVVSPSMADETQAGSDDGTGPARRSDDAGMAPGTTVGRYLVLGKLGAGAMGVVYTARDPELDRTVALKLLRPREDLAKVVSGHRKLLAEAQALARLSDPNVVTVFDVGEHSGLVFVAMELVEGSTLGEWLGQARRGWSEILAVMLQAGRGLAAVHRGDLVHRDIKPDNVMIGRDGRVRVMDFGLARAATRRAGDGAGDPHASANLPVGAFVGTPTYSAPEQLSGRRTKASADQFSYCVTLWEALHGCRPFNADSVPALVSQIMAGALTEPPADAKVPAWLRSILVRGLASEPDRRWPSMEALVLALERGRDGARRRRWIALGGAVALVGVAFGGWRWFDTERRKAACETAGDAIAEVWGQERAIDLRGALVATGVNHAETTATKVIPWLDAYAADWRGATTRACMLADVEQQWDADTLERSTWCLDERRIELESLLDALGEVEGPGVANAVSAVAGLGRLEPCTDAFALSRRPALPVDDHAAIVAVRDDLLRAGALQQIGAYDDGLALAQSVLARAEVVAWPPLVAQARDRVGKLFERRGEYPQAEQALEAAYFEAGRAGATEVAAAAAQLLVLVVGDRLARYDDGLRWAHHLELALVSLPDPSGLQAAALAEVLAQVHQTKGDYPTARRLYEDAIARYGRALGPDHPDVLRVRANLATLLTDMGEYAAARTLIQEGLRAREQALGPDHPDVGNSLNNLARAHRGLGEFVEAGALYRRALANWETSLGGDHPHVAQVLNNLGYLSKLQGDAAGARVLHERALAVRERVLGAEHPQVAQSLTNLGDIRTSLGDPQAAKVLLERALAIYEKALGPDYPEIAFALGNLATALVQLDELPAAESALLRAVAIVERTGPDHPNASLHLMNLGDVMRRRGDLDRAEQYVERALAISDAKLGGDHPGRAAIMIGLAEIAAARGHTPEAVQLAEDALARRERGGALPVEIAEARFALARFLPDRERGRALAEQAKAAYRAAGVPAAEVDAWLARIPD